MATWERPLRQSDLEALGGAAPQGPVLARARADLGATEAVPELEELLVEAWLCRAPKRLAAEYLDGSG